jgi:hypothetical protein
MLGVRNNIFTDIGMRDQDSLGTTGVDRNQWLVQHNPD